MGRISRWGHPLIGAVAACLLATACGGLAPTGTVANIPEPHGISPSTRFTPVAASVLTQPQAVKGTDGVLHLAYELALTNATLAVINVQRVEVRDSATQRVLLSLAGDGLLADMAPLGTPTPAGSEAGDAPPGQPAPDTTTIPGSSVSVVWLDVQLPVGSNVPAYLQHHVAGTIGPAAQPFDSAVATIPTDRDAATELGPPVRPGIWYASEGCCSDPTHHRRGMAPINGALYVPQRFAIDWFRLDDAHRTWIGDPSRLSSYLSFKQPVIAAADGVVVDVQNGIDDNPPPHPPALPPIENTVGNHVIVQAGRNQFLLYAHMEKDSLQMKLGQHVKRGQQLGLIGNSGNSTTPHLHFQVLNVATFFPADSRPFVFDKFQLAGRITDRIWDDNIGLQPTGTLPFAPAANPGTRRDEMPIDRDILVFPSS